MEINEEMENVDDDNSINSKPYNNQEKFGESKKSLKFLNKE